MTERAQVAPAGGSEPAPRDALMLAEGVWRYDADRHGPFTSAADELSATAAGEFRWGPCSRQHQRRRGRRPRAPRSARCRLISRRRACRCRSGGGRPGQASAVLVFESAWPAIRSSSSPPRRIPGMASLVPAQTIRRSRCRGDHRPPDARLSGGIEDGEYRRDVADVMAVSGSPSTGWGSLVRTPNDPADGLPPTRCPSAHRRSTRP